MFTHRGGAVNRKTNDAGASIAFAYDKRSRDSSNY